MSSSHNVSPINSIPPLVVAVVLAMAGIEIALELGARGMVGGQQAVGWRIALIEKLAFSSQLFQWMLETGRFGFDNLIRLVAYPLVHGSFTHMAFACVITLALGKFVGEVFHPLALVGVWLTSTIVGALTYGILVPGTAVPLFGGMVPAYGLIGAFTYMLWVRAGHRGESPLAAFRLIGFLLAFQMVFAVAFRTGDKQWVAEIGGFVAGFMISFAVSPGGWSTLVRQLRQR